MNTEEAKKIAEAIVLCVAAAYGKGKTVGELKQKCIEILTADPAAPVEKEYRAGEWAPPEEQSYWYISDNGMINDSINTRDAIDSYRISQGNMFPTEAIAEAAKKHAEWWRTFDIADEDGKVSVWAWTTGELHLSANDSKDSNPRWQSEERARAWVYSHGGEAYVSEMLTKGRVFRFKWGGQ